MNVSGTCRVLLAALAASMTWACQGGEPAGREEAPAAETAPPAEDGMPGGHPPLTRAPVPGTTLPPATVLASAGPHTVTAGDVRAAIDAMPTPDRFEYTTSEQIRELVESLIDRKLMAARARAEGLAEDPVMKEMLGTAPAGVSDDEMLAGVWLETEIARARQPGEADVERYYREHQAEFTEPARVRVTRLVAAGKPAAERLRNELVRGTAAAALSAGVADDTQSVEELWLYDVPKSPEMTRVALRLEVGEVSPVLAAANGYAVMRAEERAPARLRPLTEVRAGIRARLQEAARREALAAIRTRLRKGLTVSIDESRLASYLPSAPGAS